MSQTDEKLYDDSLNIVGLFVNSLNQRNFTMLQNTVNPERMTFDGITYMHFQRFIYTCIKLVEDMNILMTSSASYSFDDVENSPVKSSALKIFRAFDNNSMLVVAQLEFYNKFTNFTREVLFVVSRNDSRETQINAIYGLADQPKRTEKFDLKYEIYHQFGICINIPKDFTLSPDNKLVGYYLNDKSGDEAAFQIFAVKSKDLKGEASNYIKEIVKTRDFYDFSVRYFHNGYRFQFFMDDGPRKIVIINAIKVRNRIVFITFTAPRRFYETRRIEIDYCLDYIDFI